MAGNRQQVYHSLSVMLEAGMPIGRSLRTAARTAQGGFPAALRRVEAAVGAGAGLPDAMAAQGRTFQPLELAMVQAAEMSGNLAETFQMLGQWWGFRQRLRQIITSGMMLPLILLHAAAFLMPLPGLFLGGGGAGQYVPAVLAILAGFYVPAGIIAAVVLLTPRRGVLRRGLDAFVAAVPVLGRGVFHLGLARFCRAFHMLQKAGVPIVRCAAQSCQVVGNSAVARLLEGGADAARAGRNVSEGFSPRLGELFLQTWQVGEETGNMAEAAARLAGHAEETSQRIFTELARWVPRIIYFILMLMMAAAILSGGARIMTSVGLPP